MFQKFVVPIVTATIGAVLAITYQDALLKPFLGNNLSEDSVFIFTRTSEDYFFDVLVANDSTNTLDISRVSLELTLQDYPPALGGFLQPSQIYMVSLKDASISEPLVLTEAATASVVSYSIDVVHSIKPSERDLLRFKFVDPDLTAYAEVSVRIHSPNGMIFTVDAYE